MSASIFQRPLPLALAAILLPLALAGCDTLECEDGGRLEAAYHQGEEAALAQNAADFQQGRREGLALTRADGESEGYRSGFDDGYASGFWDSGDYESGYSTGYGLGFDEAYANPAACESGDLAGYNDGFNLGDADGYALGYELGYADYYQPCEVSSERDLPQKADEDDAASPKEVGQCHSRGLRSLRDNTSFQRGRSDGIAENADYLDGYNRHYDIGFGDGDTEGRVDAYDDGLSLGYSDGADEGWHLAWLDCYDAAYPEGYGAGYDAGYDAGYGDGSYDGGSGC